MTYPIGTPGQPWNEAHRQQWRARQTRRRSYDEVCARIEALGEGLEVVRYGVLDYDRRFPLYALRTEISPERPTVVVTGGVHGYETSGVLGALAFAAQWDRFPEVNIVVAPCVSPWGFEHIQRWNPDAVDPNRSFRSDGRAAEARLLMDFVRGLGPVEMHIDLHETTNSDNEEFRPAKAARDGTVQTNWNIPDGFYLVGRADRPAMAFQEAVRDAVAQVTPIADADERGELIGVPVDSHGVIVYDAVPLGLCMAMTDAPFTTTTEVYPDSPRTDPETCTAAQVQAVVAGLRYVASRR